MSGRKRQWHTVDPDYDDLTDCEEKHMSSLTNDAKEATRQKILKVYNQEFSKAIQHKQNELQLIDKKLYEAQRLIDRLRACIVANFYGSDSQLRQGTNAKQGECSQHPTFLENSEAESQFIKAEDMRTINTDRCIDNASSIASSLSVTSLSSNGDEMSVVRSLNSHEQRQKIVIGNVSKYLNDRPADSIDHATHKWMLYVRGPRDAPCIDHMISKVIFFLHPSYRPNDIVEVSSAPFHLTRMGWGEFPARIQLHLHGERQKKMDVIHHLKVIEMDLDKGVLAETIHITDEHNMIEHGNKSNDFVKSKDKELFLRIKRKNHGQEKHDVSSELNCKADVDLPTLEIKTESVNDEAYSICESMEEHRLLGFSNPIKWECTEFKCCTSLTNVKSAPVLAKVGVSDITGQSSESGKNMQLFKLMPCSNTIISARRLGHGSKLVVLSRSEHGTSRNVCNSNLAVGSDDIERKSNLSETRQFGFTEKAAECGKCDFDCTVDARKYSLCNILPSVSEAQELNKIITLSLDKRKQSMASDFINHDKLVVSSSDLISALSSTSTLKALDCSVSNVLSNNVIDCQPTISFIVPHKDSKLVENHNLSSNKLRKNPEIIYRSVESNTFNGPQLVSLINSNNRPMIKKDASSKLYSLVPTESEKNDSKKSEVKSVFSLINKSVLSKSKSILGLKKQAADVSTICEPNISIKHIHDVEDLVRSLIPHFPLICHNVDKVLHPYCARNCDEWLGWGLGKRRAAEWQRCVDLRLCTIRLIHREKDSVLKSKDVWSVKRIMMWCRQHAFSLHFLEILQSKDSREAILDSRAVSSCTDVKAVINELNQLTPQVDRPEEDLDVVNEDTSYGKFKKYFNNEGATMVATAEAAWVQHITCKIAERLMDDILRASLSSIYDGQRCWDELGISDIVHGIKSLPHCDFLTNAYFGTTDHGRLPS